MTKCEDCGHDPCDCDMVRWAHEQLYGDDEWEDSLPAEYRWADDEEEEDEPVGPEIHPDPRSPFWHR